MPWARASARAVPNMRILVCGGRNFWQPSKVNRALAHLHATRGITLLIHGAAPGADKLADDWAKAAGVERLPFPADWAGLGKRAGPVRNQQMLDEGAPDAVVAFPGGDGTRDMVRRAKACGLRVWRPYG